MWDRRGDKTRMENLETDTVVRYSIVNELNYHDPVKDHVSEPMHNLLIGKLDFVISGKPMHA